LKVAFGTSLLDRGLLKANENGIDGIGQYCQELLSQFKKNSNSPSISCYSFGSTYSHEKPYSLPSYATHAISALLRQNNHTIFESCDVIHATDQLIPIINSKPMVATVMDTIPLSHPEFLKSKSRFLKPLIWKKLTQRATRIITISDFSKQAIMRWLDYSDDLIDSIPLGVDQRYFEAIDSDEKNLILQRLGIKSPFFLFVGSIQPRKNLQRLIQAHQRLPRRLAQQYPLVIAGKLNWADNETLHSLQDAIVQKRCIWLHYVSERDKRCLMQEALALTFVSLYEGFGLPIIEAFASGLPVITSNCTSMPEIAGQAALFVDPYQTPKITEALLALIEQSSLRENLKVSGQLRARLFSWQTTATKTIAVYEKIA